MYQLPEARPGMMDPTEAGVLGLPPSEQELAVALLEKLPHLADLYGVRQDMLEKLELDYQLELQALYEDSPEGMPAWAVKLLLAPVLRDLQQQIIRLVAKDLLDNPV